MLSFEEFGGHYEYLYNDLAHNIIIINTSNFKLSNCLKENTSLYKNTIKQVKYNPLVVCLLPTVEPNKHVTNEQPIFLK